MLGSLGRAMLVRSYWSDSSQYSTVQYFIMLPVGGDSDADHIAEYDGATPTRPESFGNSRRKPLAGLQLYSCKPYNRSTVRALVHGSASRDWDICNAEPNFMICK